MNPHQTFHIYLKETGTAAQEQMLEFAALGNFQETLEKFIKMHIVGLDVADILEYIPAQEIEELESYCIHQHDKYVLLHRNNPCEILYCEIDKQRGEF